MSGTTPEAPEAAQAVQEPPERTLAEVRAAWPQLDIWQGHVGDWWARQFGVLMPVAVGRTPAELDQAIGLLPEADRKRWGPQEDGGP